jgi:hypothetical protein
MLVLDVKIPSISHQDSLRAIETSRGAFMGVRHSRAFTMTVPSSLAICPSPVNVVLALQPPETPVGLLVARALGIPALAAC